MCRTMEEIYLMTRTDNDDGGNGLCVRNIYLRWREQK